MIYIVDIDGTICKLSDGNYLNCEPLIERIDKINGLFVEGHTIIYATARGMGSTDGDQIKAHQKYYDFTLNQLEQWGCKFHSLYLGKPKGDVYIDDKAIHDIDFFRRT